MTDPVVDKPDFDSLMFQWGDGFCGRSAEKYIYDVLHTKIKELQDKVFSQELTIADLEHKIKELEEEVEQLRKFDER